uniref:Protein kinase domain-containing protein n=1 Tax=Ananas comosus var. bracteatus TaxID=296719 RepID=A0A6V7Q0Z0_ANACO|nr:unnamed protein product [Ananas comosus var. bracteatus]
MPSLLVGFFAAAVAAALFLEPSLLRVIAGDCPLDLNWLNYTLIASSCSDQNERTKCCRYMNALVAVSVARYANTTGMLGVPPAFSDTCVSTISDTLIANGVPQTATSFCGLGVKIQVFYQCEGRNTILEMLQSPNFDDVTRSCNTPLSVDGNCKICLNSGLSYLRHLIGVQDNVTLNTCRNAAFVALANQGNNLSAVEAAACFFSVQGLSILPVNSSEPFSPSFAPATSPSPFTVQAPAQHLIAVPLKDHHSHHFMLIAGIGVTIAGLAVLLLLILIILIRRKVRELKDTEITHSESRNGFSSLHVQKCQEGSTAICQIFTYKELKKATGNFSTILGRDECGIMYRAQFIDGSVAAVKQIDNVMKQRREEFCREVQLLSRLHHRHLVALKGFCSTKSERFLVYEYMENGSLKDHLHSSEKPPLVWQTRIRIAIDVANALEYLHFYCDPPLFHGDITSSNILLDRNFLAKVADFGLVHYSRNGNTGFLPVNTKIQGTPGVVDSEYAVTQEMTSKIDVYNYGIMLLELVTGKPAMYDKENPVDWSQKFTSTEYYSLQKLVDPTISDSIDLDELEMVVELIDLCTQKESRERPSMKQVLRILYERFDPAHREFVKIIEEEEDYCNGERKVRGKEQQFGELIPFSSDARGLLQSSSSTSRSYCSRSVLLENISPESPHGIFSA